MKCKNCQHPIRRFGKVLVTHSDGHYGHAQLCFYCSCMKPEVEK